MAGDEDAAATPPPTGGAKPVKALSKDTLAAITAYHHVHWAERNLARATDKLLALAAHVPRDEYADYVAETTAFDQRMGEIEAAKDAAREARETAARKTQHEVTYGEGGASCSCGWSGTNKDGFAHFQGVAAGLLHEAQETGAIDRTYVNPGGGSGPDPEVL